MVNLIDNKYNKLSRTPYKHTQITLVSLCLFYHFTCANTQEALVEKGTRSPAGCCIEKNNVKENSNKLSNNKQLTGCSYREDGNKDR